MDTTKVYLFVYDTKENFEKSKNSLGRKGVNFKDIICIESREDFDREISTLDNQEEIFVVVHAFYTKKISGIIDFKHSGIIKSYPFLEFVYISEGDNKEIQKEMVEQNFPSQKIYKYHEIQESLEKENLRPVAKSLLTTPLLNSINGSENIHKYPQIKYAIITALREEFEQLADVFDFPDADSIKTQTKVFKIGHLKSDKSKKIVAVVQNEMGMVDASILTTQLLEFFRPDYLFMSGVCGGSDSYNIGDVIVAKKVYTFQKGKISNVMNTEDDLASKNLSVPKHADIVSEEDLFDNKGNKIGTNFVFFEIEPDSANGISSKIEDELNDILKRATIELNDNNLVRTIGLNNLKIAIAPMACSTMVINEEGFFEKKIKSIDRKIAAVDMESYGVARACELANNNKTTPIIIKAIMDNTKNKIDSKNGINVKALAAFTSAQVLKFIITEDVL